MPKRNLAKYVLCFVAGVIATAIVGGWLVRTDRRHTTAVNLPGGFTATVDEEGMTAIGSGRGWVRLNPSPGPAWHEYDVKVVGPGAELVFEVRWEGPYGTPAAVYHAGRDGNSHAWYDDNADGLFDRSLDLGRREVLIRTRDGWVAVRRATEGLAEGQDSHFTFDQEEGLWLPQAEPEAP